MCPPPPDDVGTPPRAARAAYRATVERIHQWTPRTRSLFLRLPSSQRLVFKPGQFISVAIPGGAGEPIVRAYSLASSPEDELLEICVDHVPGGPGSTHLCALVAGAAVDFTGPFGSFLLDEPPEAEMVFVADGTGIAPVRPMVRRAIERGGSATVRVLHGARAPDELLFRDELDAWQRRQPRFGWERFLTGAAGGAGDNPALEAAVIARYVDADADRSRRFWICGVGDLVRRLRDRLRGAGYERRAVRYEQW